MTNEEWINMFINKFNESKDYRITDISDREKLLDELRPTGEWIPVSERFPQIATKCLVTLSNGYITIGEYFSIDKWIFIETSFSMVYPKETVIAWMPLPKPYEKGGEEE